MANFKNNLNRFLQLVKSERLFITHFAGALLAWILREPLSNLFFGRGFDGRSLVVQLILWIAYTTLISWLLVGLAWLATRFLPKTIKEAPKRWFQVKGFDISSAGHRLLLALVIVGVGVSGIFLVNNAVSQIHTADWSFNPVNPIPVISPVGFDYRIGSYETAATLYNSHFRQIREDGSYASIYPPLVPLLNLPYLLVNENVAYLIHVGLLILSNLLCLAIVTWLAKKYLFSRETKEQNLIAAALGFLFFMMVLYLFSSYGFIFSIERGNTDIFALLLSLLAVWALVKRPDSLWLQVVLLSVATHLKIYPAVLFLLLLYKHGKKLILPALVVNLVFLFILGPKMVVDFLTTITSSSGVGAGFGNSWTWVGNHAAYAFADLMARDATNYSDTLIVLWGVFSIVPLILWGLASRKLLSKQFTPEDAFLYTMVSIPLMDLFPTVSMDYKLVILATAALMLLIVLFKQILQSANPWLFVQLGIVLFLMFLIGRGYVMSAYDAYGLKETASVLINNKYLWSLGLQIVMVWNILKHHQSTPLEQIQD